MTYNVFSGTLNPTQSINPPHLSSASALPCKRGNPEVVHCACNTVQLLPQSWLTFLSIVPPKSPKLNALITRFRESYWLVSWSLTSLFSTNMAISETRESYSSMSMCRDSRKNTEEIKEQLVEFWQCTNTASEKCNFRASPFCQVVQKHKLFEVA